MYFFILQFDRFFFNVWIMQEEAVSGIYLHPGHDQEGRGGHEHPTQGR